MTTRRVWVTGIGAITAAGVGKAALLDALQCRRSGVRSNAIEGLPAGRAPDPPRGGAARRLDRSAALFVAAAEEAWRDAGLAEAIVDPARCGVIEGSSLGPMAGMLDGACDDSPPRPTDLLRFMVGAGGASTAHGHHLHGSVLHVSAGSVSSLCAIGEAWLHIASGRADVMVAGGAECTLQRRIVDNGALATLRYLP